MDNEARECQPVTSPVVRQALWTRRTGAAGSCVPSICKSPGRQSLLRRQLRAKCEGGHENFNQALKPPVAYTQEPFPRRGLCTIAFLSNLLPASSVHMFPLTPPNPLCVCLP